MKHATARQTSVVCKLTQDEKERCILWAEYLISNRCTVRAVARNFGVSKSTVHKDITERLPYISRSLYEQAKEVMQINKAERHIRGGQATRVKYATMRSHRKPFA